MRKKANRALFYYHQYYNKKCIVEKYIHPFRTHCAFWGNSVLQAICGLAIYYLKPFAKRTTRCFIVVVVVKPVTGTLILYLKYEEI